MHTRLKYWRLRRALTQYELAKKAKVSNQTVVNIEKYGQLPLPATIRKLAEALNIPSEDLFTDDLSQADGGEAPAA